MERGGRGNAGMVVPGARTFARSENGPVFIAKPLQENAERPHSSLGYWAMVCVEEGLRQLDYFHTSHQYRTSKSLFSSPYSSWIPVWLQCLILNVNLLNWDVSLK